MKTVKKVISIQEMFNEESKLIDFEILKLEEQQKELKYIWYQNYAWRL